MLRRMLVLLVMFIVCIVPAAAQDTPGELLYAVWSETGVYHIYRFNPVSRESVPVGDVSGTGSDAGWSRDGRYIYRVSRDERRTLTLVDTRDGSERLITDNLRPDYCTNTLSWSPDSRWMAYLTGDERNYAAHLLNLETGAVEDLPDAGYDASYTNPWSPDSRYFVYWPNGSIAVWDMEQMKMAASLSQRSTLEVHWLGMTGRLAYSGGDNVYVYDLVTGSETAYDGDYVASVSPDGRYVLSRVLSSPDAYETTLIDTIEQTQQALPGELNSPAWSFDGRYVFYGVFVHDVRENSTRQLSDNPRLPFLISPAPGSYQVALAFRSMQDDIGSLEFYDLDASTSQEFDLHPFSDMHGKALNWSSDSRYLAIQAVEGLSLLDTSTGTLQPAVSDDYQAASPHYAGQARFSPEGLYLAFGATTSNWRVNVMDIQANTGYTLPTDDDAIVQLIGWQGSGTNISLIFCGEG